ncbi:hypothetical protein FSP39_011782 [Pinctada imbricata]|uniref:Uncharacterized protein n=1 Tax=Pinctada imbricata TaxID=66713 RepID=A0AA88XIU0_PINIB|nr:hypothetical protein FSP39_011782 [Pinctada imbricata]
MTESAETSLDELNIIQIDPGDGDKSDDGENDDKQCENQFVYSCEISSQSEEENNVPEFEICHDSDTGNDVTCDAELTDSDALEPSRHDEGRRQSKWSATILFVASEIQLIVNLAELCPPEGFETRPNQDFLSISLSRKNPGIHGITLGLVFVTLDL